MKKIISTILCLAVLFCYNGEIHNYVYANSISSAEEISIGKVNTHNYIEAYEDYWYKFTAQTNSYEFLLTFSKTTDKLTELTNIYLYDSSRTIIDFTSEYVPSKEGFYFCNSDLKKGSTYYIEIEVPQKVTTYFSVVEHNHKFEKTYVSQATTSYDGYIEYTCSTCGKTKEKTIPSIIVKVSPKKSEYNGKVNKPKITIKDRTGKKFVKDKDYSCWADKVPKKVGYYNIDIEFANGNYYASAEYYITPKSTKIKSIKANKGGFSVKWKPICTQNDGYQIQYSTDKNFKKNRKTLTISNNETSSKKIKKLKQKKKYYIRVRTYSEQFWFKISSSWSEVKCVTTK